MLIASSAAVNNWNGPTMFSGVQIIFPASNASKHAGLQTYQYLSTLHLVTDTICLSLLCNPLSCNNDICNNSCCSCQY